MHPIHASDSKSPIYELKRSRCFHSVCKLSYHKTKKLRLSEDRIWGGEGK